MNTNRSSRFVPIIMAVSVVVGILIGVFFSNRFSGNRLNIINTSSNKLNDLLHFIDDKYVDTVNIADLVESAMPMILSELDPHSSYISASDAATANDELRGSFSGIGVQFTVTDDSVRISGIIEGGPSEKVGLMPGDRIISVDGEKYVGKVVTEVETIHRLKGEKGSKVKLGVFRPSNKKRLSFTIERGDVPVRSIDATYMLTPSLGYIKVNKFGETTYAELLVSLAKLEQQDFKGLVIDLRGNGGGYLSSAIQMANEFLSKNKLIVYTQGRKFKREEYKSDGRGAYQNIPLYVLTDEITASASEIFSGAIQDNDRGVIVGRRTYGKGLVQQPIEFQDGSRINLTIARYYTPSGRCIQKPYTLGNAKDYEMDILNRYQHGEFFNEDSIRQTGQVYKTISGRKVYGGGGIMPDFFVAEDTLEMTPYFSQSLEYMPKFCIRYTDNNRSTLSKYKTPDEIVKYLRSQAIVEQFVKYVDAQGIARRNNMIRKSRRLFERALCGAIIYNMLDTENYTIYSSFDDPTVGKAKALFEERMFDPRKIKK